MSLFVQILLDIVGNRTYGRRHDKQTDLEPFFVLSSVYMCIYMYVHIYVCKLIPVIYIRIFIVFSA